MTNRAPSSRSPRAGGGKAREAEAGFTALLAEASRAGFYGTVTLSVTVQDGFIQQVRLASDRVVRSTAG